MSTMKTTTQEDMMLTPTDHERKVIESAGYGNAVDMLNAPSLTEFLTALRKQARGGKVVTLDVSVAWDEAIGF